MEENPKNNEQEKQPEIVVNNYGATRDDAVVVEEADRTVLLTDEETIVVEKSPATNVVPKNRPRKVYAGMWGPAEIATVGLGLLTVLTVILVFVFLVLPAKKELEENRAKTQILEQELFSMREKYGSITNTEQHVANLVNSVNDFESRFLRFPTNGKTELYQRVNGLIGAYGLVNTTGPDYEPLEIDPRQTVSTSEGESGKAKYQSLFPGTYVTMTVEGSYQNLRRFIRELETSDQFIVISAVELEPAEGEDKQNSAQTTQASINQVEITPNLPNTSGIVDQNATPQQFGTQTTVNRPARGKTHGETVSLRLEMAAYFRRPGFVPLNEGTVNQ